MSDAPNGDSGDLLDGTDPIDDAAIENRLEPSDLDETLEEAAHDAEKSGTGGLLDNG